MVDLGERQLLAQPVSLAFVALAVKRLGEQERLVQPLELLLGRPDPSFLFRRTVFRLCPPLFLDVEDAVLHQAHVAGRRLQEREFVGERAFELGLADVHRATLALTVVVRVMFVAPLRPAAPERPAARIAAHESTPRKVGMIPLTWTGNYDASVEYGLRAVERGLVDKRLEVGLGRDAAVRALDSSYVDRIPHHLPEALWRQSQALSAAR